jgi:hypothetical protein
VVTYGGGGGAGNIVSGVAGTGGVGGGGSGVLNGTAGAGTVNTGGGSAGNNNVGAAGGSGIVIIRYPSTYKAAASSTGSPTITLDSGGFNIYKFTASGSITF